MTKCTVINWRPMSEFPKDSDDEFLFLGRYGGDCEISYGFHQSQNWFLLGSGTLGEGRLIEESSIVAWCPKPDFSQFDEVKP